MHHRHMSQVPRTTPVYHHNNILMLQWITTELITLSTMVVMINSVPEGITSPDRGHVMVIRTTKGEIRGLNGEDDREAVQEAVQELVQEAVREVVQEVDQEVVHQAARMIGDVERGVPVRADENQNLLTTANATTLQRQPMQKKRRRKPVGVHRRLQRRNIRRFPRRKFVQILPVAQIPLLVVEKSRRIG